MSSLAPLGIRHERGSSRKSGSTLQKIAQKKEQLRHYPRVKKLEKIAAHLHCEVSSNVIVANSSNHCSSGVGMGLYDVSLHGLSLKTSSSSRLFFVPSSL